MEPLVLQPQELISANKQNELRSRFFPRFSRQEADGQHLSVGLVRLYAENSMGSPTLGLRKCELIKSCYFKQQRFVVIRYAGKKTEYTASDMTYFKILPFEGS